MLHSRSLLYSVLYPLIIPRHGPHGKPSCYQECVLIGLLPSYGCPIVASVISGMCLPSRCLVMVICVTILWKYRSACVLCRSKWEQTFVKVCIRRFVHTDSFGRTSNVRHWSCAMMVSANGFVSFRNRLNLFCHSPTLYISLQPWFITIIDWIKIKQGNLD
jgi:hypothetical protein